jgi:hypothetical protein
MAGSINVSDTAPEASDSLVSLLQVLTNRAEPSYEDKSVWETATYELSDSTLSAVRVSYDEGGVSFLVLDGETEVFRFDGSTQTVVEDGEEVLAFDGTGTLSLNHLTTEQVEQLRRAAAQGV